MAIIEHENIKYTQIYENLDFSKRVDENAVNFLMAKLNSFISRIDKKVTILDINKKSHTKNSTHYKFKAVDIYISDITINDLDFIVKAALNSCFKGIGVYKNEKGIYSFHLDLRANLGFWRGTKEKANDPWTYSPLIKF